MPVVLFQQQPSNRITLSKTRLYSYKIAILGLNTRDTPPFCQKHQARLIIRIRSNRGTMNAQRNLQRSHSLSRINKTKIYITIIISMSFFKLSMYSFSSFQFNHTSVYAFFAHFLFLFAFLLLFLDSSIVSIIALSSPPSSPFFGRTFSGYSSNSS